MQHALRGTDGGRIAPAAAPRRPALGASSLVVVSFAVAAPLSELLAALGGARAPTAALAVSAVAALLLGRFARPGAALVIGPLFWLFLDGFVVHRSGTLGWDGTQDGIRLAVLAGAGVGGALVRALVSRVRGRAGWPGRGEAAGTARRRWSRSSRCSPGRAPLVLELTVRELAGSGTDRLCHRSAAAPAGSG
ncbi:hypothetical protein GXW82_21420 [Streptacidiphilus sp. 4-A2]|nr:hypothetical protein [Streptacidiphilus sp. 4-A2]